MAKANRGSKKSKKKHTHTHTYAYMYIWAHKHIYTNSHVRAANEIETEWGETCVLTTNDTIVRRHRRKQTHALLPETQGHIETNERTSQTDIFVYSNRGTHYERRYEANKAQHSTTQHIILQHWKRDWRIN